MDNTGAIDLYDAFARRQYRAGTGGHDGDPKPVGRQIDHGQGSRSKIIEALGADQPSATFLVAQQAIRIVAREAIGGRKVLYRRRVCQCRSVNIWPC